MRYADRYLGEFLRQDFVKRQRLPNFLQFILIFLGSYIMVLLAQTMTHSFSQFAFIILIMLAFVNGVMVWNIQNSRDLLLVTEFQNAIFSSALGVSNLFCMVVRQDGAIVHADAKFYTLFSQIKEVTRRDLTDVFSILHMPKEQITAVIAALSAGLPQQHVVVMQTGAKESAKFVLSVDPLTSPTGYVLLRGRQYVEQRSA